MGGKCWSYGPGGAAGEEAKGMAMPAKIYNRYDMREAEKDNIGMATTFPPHLRTMST
jgi:hypothetical protein